MIGDELKKASYGFSYHLVCPLFPPICFTILSNILLVVDEKYFKKSEY